MVGEDQKFASAIISVDKTWLKEWAAENGLSDHTPEELVEMDQTLKAVRAMLAPVNDQLSTYERVKRVRLVTDSWTQQNGFLSVALKLKRAVLINHYSDLIAEIYNIAGEA